MAQCQTPHPCVQRLAATTCRLALPAPPNGPAPVPCPNTPANVSQIEDALGTDSDDQSDSDGA